MSDGPPPEARSLVPPNVARREHDWQVDTTDRDHLLRGLLVVRCSRCHIEGYVGIAFYAKNGLGWSGGDDDRPAMCEVTGRMPDIERRTILGPALTVELDGPPPDRSGYLQTTDAAWPREAPRFA